MNLKEVMICIGNLKGRKATMNKETYLELLVQYYIRNRISISYISFLKIFYDKSDRLGIQRIIASS